jgi:hypothetical protein
MKTVFDAGNKVNGKGKVVPVLNYSALRYEGVWGSGNRSTFS